MTTKFFSLCLPKSIRLILLLYPVIQLGCDIEVNKNMNDGLNGAVLVFFSISIEQ